MCLTLLEDAHERGEVLVDAVLARKLRPVVPSIADGMPITGVLDDIFSRQEPYLLRESRPSPSPGATSADVPAIPTATVGGPTQALSRTEAAALTRRIRSTCQPVCLLMLEAHERKAWVALGYRSWGQYVRREFELSRRRSYELVDQGRVVRLVQEVSGMSGVPAISAYAALQIKPHLNEVARAIGLRRRGLPEPELAQLVRDVVDDIRGRIPARPIACAGPAAGRTTGLQVDRLLDAIELLGRMPPPALASAAITPDLAHRLASIDAVAAWMSDFAWHVRKRALAVAESVEYATSP
jgi:hypothetical protein